ncbi:MAG: hypothetical protein M1818_006052 [Claussenomyces sp. TS43310]|nr:MAG: hypothetical protein M1818_006052 [Claussenomyces sp. TS43310]
MTPPGVAGHGQINTQKKAKPQRQSPNRKDQMNGTGKQCTVTDPPFAPSFSAQSSTPQHKFPLTPGRRTFTLFPHLPAELRLKIWEEVLHITHRPDVWLSPRPSPVFDIHGNRYLVHGYVYTTPKQPIPCLLRTSHEARVTALQHYQLAFAAQTSGPRIYLNYARDRPFIRTRSHEEFNTFVDNLSEPDLAGLQQITLRLSDWASSISEEFADGLTKFKGLKRVLFLVCELDGEVYTCDLKETGMVIKEELKLQMRRHPHWQIPRISLRLWPQMAGLQSL